MTGVNRSALRTLVMLDALAHSVEPISLAQLTAALDIPKSSAHGLLAALLETEYAETCPGGGYRLGLRAFEVGSTYSRQLDQTSAAEPELARLTTELDVTAHFAVLHGDEVVYVAKKDPPRRVVQLASALGARLPASQTAVGKAQLAHLSDEPHGAHVGDPDLQRELELVRTRGFAVDEGQTASGVRCVAAPVFGVSGCLGAIGVSAWLDPSADVEHLAQHVLEAAARTSARLGGRSWSPQ
jgi:DNA-binding IclR family transcriptional regulator